MNTGWQDLARCAEVDPELFFPEKGERDGDLAKRVCAGCEVRAECLAWALAQPERIPGIWGGTSENERRRIRQRTGAAA